MRQLVALSFTIFVLFLILITAQSAVATPCEQIAPHTANLTMVSATPVSPPLTVTSGFGTVTISTAFCRVVGFLTPTPDSHIGFEVWLPPTGAWNHRFLGVGNGGFAGALNYSGMAPAFKLGYATMTTDEGHVNIAANPIEDITWARGHPQKVIDFGYRAEHLSTLAAKAIIDAYYGDKPTHSYFMGCSAGGHQGITESQRFPTDYDGYVVGDAGLDHIDTDLDGFWAALAASLADPANALEPAQLQMVHSAVLKQCAGKDGGLPTDGFLTDPRSCHFDPQSLLCKSGQDASICLTAGQITAFEKVYSGPRNPRTKELIDVGFPLGSEITWTNFVGKKNPAGTERPWAGVLASMVYEDPDYLTGEKYLKFNFDTDYLFTKKKIVGGQTLGSIFDNSTPRLDAIRREGAKIIHYWGWMDGTDPAVHGIEYFERIVSDQASLHHLSPDRAFEQTLTFYRLFLVPGMGHCSGGPGPTNFGQFGQAAVQVDPEHDTLSALERWVEHGVAPGKMIASHVDGKEGAVGMTRPICPYPQISHWVGSGSTDDAKNFVCAAGP